MLGPNHLDVNAEPLFLILGPTHAQPWIPGPNYLDVNAEPDYTPTHGWLEDCTSLDAWMDPPMDCTSTDAWM